MPSVESSGINFHNLRAQRSSIHEVLPGKIGGDSKLNSQNPFYNQQIPENLEKYGSTP